MTFNLTDLTKPTLFRNLSPATLYEHAIKYEEKSFITSTGALIAYSGEKTGRSPQDKRILREPSSEKDIDWNQYNMECTTEEFQESRDRAFSFLNEQERLYVIDSFAGWDKKHRIKVRIVCSRPYHALFMHNMLIRPSLEELKNFGEPDYTVYNAGSAPGQTRVALNFAQREFVILGTNYAGEMKKGVFTIMNYLLPKAGIISLHSSVNVGKQGDVSIFLGLSGTGKTTLSADVNRFLIGDDEHYWTDEGLFNIEGGCYAKCDKLSQEKEPEIFEAIRFGALLENVKFDENSRKVDYNDLSITENTRASYCIEAIRNVKIPCHAGHAKNIIFLTADAFGIFPPISKLTVEQAMYFFVNGYTAKIAGTEVGVKEPKATFSACYGGPFMIWHPYKYAELLANQIQKHNCTVWLLNTGWTGGGYDTGKRISLKNTRSILDAIHAGQLHNGDFENIELFNLQIPKNVPEVPSDILNPQKTWQNQSAYTDMMNNLVNMFKKNNDEIMRTPLPYSSKFRESPLKI